MNVDLFGIELLNVGIEFSFPVWPGYEKHGRFYCPLCCFERVKENEQVVVPSGEKCHRRCLWRLAQYTPWIESWLEDEDRRMFRREMFLRFGIGNSIEFPVHID